MNYCFTDVNLSSSCEVLTLKYLISERSERDTGCIKHKVMWIFMLRLQLVMCSII